MPQYKEVAALLHSRGREATIEQVEQWCERMRGFLRDKRGIDASHDVICEAVLDHNKTMTMCLHIHFGDAL